MDAIGLADRGNQILHGQAALFHAETNCFDGVGRLDRGMPGFVGFHQRDHDLEAVAFLAARLRLVVDVSGHLAHCGLVIGPGTDAMDVHGYSSTVADPSTWSPCKRVMPRAGRFSAFLLHRYRQPNNSYAVSPHCL